jgi:uncharacterized iron-regulated membrane protein
VDQAVQTARTKMPHMIPFFVAYPGSLFSSKSHYIVFMRGDAPLTARLLTPVMIDAVDGSFTDSRSLPWYVSMVLLSQPLHFGDYGGLPLKIVWALLDLGVIGILLTGLYLWLARRRVATSSRSIKRRTTGEGRHDLDLSMIYRGPLALAVLSLIGLVTALVGDGIWDAIGWLCLAVPALVMVMKSYWAL